MKFGRGAKDDVLYRRGPKRLEDRLPVLQTLGSFLDVGVPNRANRPGSLSYIRTPNVPEVAPSQSSSQGYSSLVFAAAARLLLTVDFFILNMCSGHRRPGDVADHAARITFGRLRI